MSCIPFKTKFFFQSLLATAPCLFFLVCCTSPGQKETKLIQSPENTRLEGLEAELRDQRTEIQKISAAIEVMTLRLEDTGLNNASNNVKKSSKLPISKKSSIEPNKESKTKTPKGGEKVKLSTKPNLEPKNPASEKPVQHRTERQSTTSKNTPDVEVIADSQHEEMHWYYQGLELLKRGEFDQTVNALRTFLKENPDHVYADRAEYLISRAHFLNREYGLVIVATNLLESRYPFSYKVPDALFHRALSFLNLGQKELAKDTLGELLEKFPKNPVSQAASRKLAELSVTRTGSHGNVPILNHTEPQ